MEPEEGSGIPVGKEEGSGIPLGNDEGSGIPLGKASGAGMFAGKEETFGIAFGFGKVQPAIKTTMINRSAKKNLVFISLFNIKKLEWISGYINITSNQFLTTQTI